MNKLIQSLMDVLFRPKKFFENIGSESFSDSLKFIVSVVLTAKLFSFVVTLLIASMNINRTPIFWGNSFFVYRLIDFFYELILVAANVVIFSICLYLGFRIVGSKKGFKQTFKVVGYIFAFVSLFSVFVVLFRLLIYSGNYVFGNITSTDLLGVGLICLWAVVLGVYGMFLTHGMTVGKTIKGFLASFTLFLLLAFIIFLFVIFVLIFKNGRP